MPVKKEWHRAEQSLNIYDKYIDEFNKNIDVLRNQDKCREHKLLKETNWTKYEKGGIVLANEVAVELGHPKKESASFFL